MYPYLNQFASLRDLFVSRDGATALWVWGCFMNLYLNLLRVFASLRDLPISRDGATALRFIRPMYY